MTDRELIERLEYLRNTMISVATGGPRIDEVNDKYQQIHSYVSSALENRGQSNAIPYGSLWDWHGRWTIGDLPSYQSRRMYVLELVNPIINLIRAGPVEELQPTGWRSFKRLACCAVRP